MIVLICAVTTIVLLGYVFYPERQVASQTEKTRLEFLRERKDLLYENLRDLNFEYRAGKYRDEEYASERAVMENQAAEVVGELEQLEAVRR